MSKSGLEISIEKPCTENWQNMLPNHQGRHCSQCNKNVIDFSNYSDRELLNWLSKNQGNACGRLTHYQVNRTISPLPSVKNHFSIPYRLFLASMIGLGLLNKAEGRSIPVPRNIEILPQSIPANQKPGAHPDEINTGKRILVRVLDSATGNPMRNVQLYVYFSERDTGYYTTDDKGEAILIMRSVLSEDAKIYIDGFYYEDYYCSPRIIDLRNPDSGHLTIRLKLHMVIIMGRMTVKHRKEEPETANKETIWKKITRPFRK
jgi:hypothetical protein